MKLTQIAVDNPVFATMMMVALLVMGLFSYRQLGIDQFPNVELYTVEDEFGGWQKATEEHFSDGGLIDDVFVAQ